MRVKALRRVFSLSLPILIGTLVHGRQTIALASPSMTTSSGSSLSPPAPPPPARPAMQKFAEQLSFLLQNMPVMSAPSPEQRNRVLQVLQQLKSSSHQIQSTMQLYAVDPVMQYLSFDLSKQFLGIEQAYTAAQYPQARYLLRKTTQTCVGCHSASSNKASAVMSFPEPMAGIGNMERAEYFAATRRHEEAMLAYEKALSQKDFKLAQPERWNEALNNLIAITVRLRNSPHMTLEMISSLLEDTGLRPEQRALLLAWRASAKAWTQEKLNSKMNPSEQLTKAQVLLEQGKQSSRKQANYGYIDYLRAMNLLNEVAMSSSPDEVKATSFYLAGEAAQRLKDILIWAHPEAYYEACIRLRPRSPEAKKCWTSLQTLATNPDLSKQLGPLVQ